MGRRVEIVYLDSHIKPALSKYELKYGVVGFWEKFIFSGFIKILSPYLGFPKQKNKEDSVSPIHCSVYLYSLSLQPEEEPDPEERDSFLQQLYKFMEDRGIFMLII